MQLLLPLCLVCIGLVFGAQDSLFLVDYAFGLSSWNSENVFAKESVLDAMIGPLTTIQSGALDGPSLVSLVRDLQIGQVTSGSSLYFTAESVQQLIDARGIPKDAAIDNANLDRTVSYFGGRGSLSIASSIDWASWKKAYAQNIDILLQDNSQQDRIRLFLSAWLDSGVEPVVASSSAAPEGGGSSPAGQSQKPREGLGALLSKMVTVWVIPPPSSSNKALVAPAPDATSQAAGSTESLGASPIDTSAPAVETQDSPQSGTTATPSTDAEPTEAPVETQAPSDDSSVSAMS